MTRHIQSTISQSVAKHSKLVEAGDADDDDDADVSHHHDLDGRTDDIMM